MKSLSIISTLGLLTALSMNQAVAQPEIPMREMRGVWLTTVVGLDFPDGVGFDPANQREKIDQLLDQTEAAGLNTVIFQLRGECDAHYISNYEPWSRTLTGAQGAEPLRPWDPFQYTIDECRRRGLEIHGWLNPYRAGLNPFSSYDADHPSRDRPELVVNFNNDYLWLNPGKPETIEYNLDILRDIITRYDIDGLHFDDYFYPYEVNDAGGTPFPDSAEFAQYGNGLSLADWRRKNVDDLVKAIHDLLRETPESEHVRLGISPFGIWRPGSQGGPSGISGFDAYARIYADSRKWIQQGWVDYMMPQIYWGRAADGHRSTTDYDTLHDWWADPVQNPLNRHIVPGTPAYKIGGTDAGVLYTAEHIVNMATYTQGSARSHGNLYFRTENLSVQQLDQLLANGPYQEESIPPYSSWLGLDAPGKPNVFYTGVNYTGFTGRWTPSPGSYPQWYVAAWERNDEWSYDVVPSWQRSIFLSSFPGGTSPEQFAVAAVGRDGAISDFATVELVSAPVAEPAWFPLADFDQRSWNFLTTSGTNRNVDTSADTNSSAESNNRIDPEIAEKGSISRRIAFTWTGSVGRYRLSTFGENPQIDFSKGIGFYCKLFEGELDIALGIRETGGEGAIGSDGGTTGDIERTQSIRISESPNWQYLYFDISREEYTSVTGDGVLDGNTGVLENLWITQVGSGAQSIELYIDDFHQGEPHTPLGEPLRPRYFNSFPSHDSITISWDAVPSRDVASYRVYRGPFEDFEPSEDNMVGEVTSTFFTDNDLTPDTQYFYRFITVDHFGYESFASATVSAQTNQEPGGQSDGYLIY